MSWHKVGLGDLRIALDTIDACNYEELMIWSAIQRENPDFSPEDLVKKFEEKMAARIREVKQTSGREASDARGAIIAEALKACRDRAKQMIVELAKRLSGMQHQGREKSDHVTGR